MSELFLEIEEDIKRERFDSAWRKVGRIAVLGSIAIVVATAILVAYKNYTTHQAEAQTAKLLLASSRIEAQDYKGAISVLSPLTDDSSSAYYPLAMIRKAQAQELNGDADGAKKTYAALAKNSSELSVLAKLKSVEKDATVEIAATAPFYYTGAEFNAWQLLSVGKKSEAAEIFSALTKDEKAPQSITSRANEALRVVAPEKLTEKSTEKSKEAFDE